ncbi:MAG: DUF1460 domain-containing protein [Candidatus Micrarchaeota archaeon]|nr:DUF1460 domain-containing protein [Candidatus Micrarchaeota archaeon]
MILFQMQILSLEKRILPGTTPVKVGFETKENLGTRTRQDIDRLIEQAKQIVDMGERVAYLAEQFIGTRFGDKTLGGGPGKKEVFIVNLERMDCVTAVETFVAMANAKDYNDFLKKLQGIRYKDGSVSWESRNHYSSAWIRENQRYVSNVTAIWGGIPFDKTLDIVKGVPTVRVHGQYIPRNNLDKALNEMKDGDIIFFTVSNSNLDVGHSVIVKIRDNGVKILHASREKGKLIEVDLVDYLNRVHRFTGIIVVRPQ